jgi:hypothetical protein
MLYAKGCRWLWSSLYTIEEWCLYLIFETLVKYEGGGRGMNKIITLLRDNYI